MVYNGYFRNNDTSVDPLGQLYKVLIFTNISKDGYWQLHEETGGGGGGISRLYPTLASEILLSGDPFVVEYQNDSSNVYKPYKCSTATVGIMMDRFDSNLISVKKNDILVYLLKRKNEIREETYIDRKRLINNNTDEFLDSVWCWNEEEGHLVQEFDPRRENSFAYDVEWVGYATPNTYNQNYVRVLESYSLECQDALSTLRYYDYKKIGDGVVSFRSVLESILQNIDGVYNHIYTSDATFRKLDESGQSYNLRRCVLDELFCQEDNWFDEDGEAVNCLEVLEEMMKYLTLTIIPYKDTLYITNADAIVGKHKKYWRYEYLDNLDSLFVPRGPRTRATDESQIEIGREIDFSEMAISNADTNLSLSDTYRRVKVTTDEYYYDDSCTNLNDSDQFEIIPNDPSLPEGESTMWDHISTLAEVVKVTGERWGPSHYSYENFRVCNAGSLLRPTTKNRGTIETKHYNIDGWNSNNNAPIFNRTPIAEPTSWNGVWSKCGCTPIEISLNRIDEDTALRDVNANYSGSRMFLFNTPTITRSQSSGGSTVTPETYNRAYFWGDQPDLIQPMLTVTTPKMWFARDNYLNLVGNWTFYNTRYLPVPTKWDNSINKNLIARSYLMFVWAKVKFDCGSSVKWLKNSYNTNSHYDYEWSNTEQWVKLYYGGIGYSNFHLYLEHGEGRRGHDWYSDTPAFENTFSFIKNNRAVEGTAVRLPDEGYGAISVTFNRPVGCAQERYERSNTQYVYFAQVTTLENFEINVLSGEDMKYRHEAIDYERDRSNGSYTVEMAEYAVDDYGDVRLKLSSGLNKATNKSLVWRQDDFIGNYSAPVNVINDALQIQGYPENNLARSIAGTYKIPHLIVDQSFHNHNIHPLYIYTWVSQFGTKKFIIDNLTIDYKNNSNSVRLFEKSWTRPDKLTAFIDKARNLRRNNDTLANPLPKSSKMEVDTPPEIRFGFVTIYRGTGVDDLGCMMMNDLSGVSATKFTRIQANVTDGDIMVWAPDYCAVEAINEDGELIIKTPDVKPIVPPIS